MQGYVNTSGNYEMEEFGIVHISVRRNTRSIRARWNGQRIDVGAPTGVPAQRVLDALRIFAPKMNATKPARLYSPGDRFVFPEVAVTIDVSAQAPDKMTYKADAGKWSIHVGQAWDFDSHETTRAISDCICRMAKREAPAILLPYARSVAAEIGISPTAWKISNGHRVLGHCSASREIALSYLLVFLPEDLRRFIICHELAHLSEMNHSPRFHALCDSYLDGREAELYSALKAFAFPVLR